MDKSMSRMTATAPATALRVGEAGAKQTLICVGDKSIGKTYGNGHFAAAQRIVAACNAYPGLVSDRARLVAALRACVENGIDAMDNARSLLRELGE